MYSNLWHCQHFLAERVVIFEKRGISNNVRCSAASQVVSVHDRLFKSLQKYEQFYSNWTQDGYVVVCRNVSPELNLNQSFCYSNHICQQITLRDEHRSFLMDECSIKFKFKLNIRKLFLYIERRIIKFSRFFKRANQLSKTLQIKI